MNNEFLSKAPIGKLLFKLSIPTVVAQLINMLYNLVDRIFIGHMSEIGDLALTGVGVCLPLIMLVSAFASLVSAGGAPRASIFMGKKDNETAEKIMGNCFLLQIIISFILTIILLVFNRELLLLFGAGENTIEYAVKYMNVYAIGTLFVQLTLGMNAYITSQGFSKIAMITVLIGAICNIALDPIFIYVFNMYTNIYVVNETRDKYVKMQAENINSEIVVCLQPFPDYIWCGSPKGDYLERAYKNYYKIDQKIDFTFMEYDEFQNWKQEYDKIHTS